MTPGSLALAPVSTKERLEAAVEEARYHLGPIAWSPWFAVKDVTYIKGDELVTSGGGYDLTATAAAGVHAYLRPRPSLYFAAHAIPEYAWWKDNEKRTVTNWSYGAGAFVFSSRFTLEAAVTSARHQEYVSSEFEQLVNTRRDESRATVELPLFGRLAVYASGSATEWRYRKDDLEGSAGELLLSLDRDENRIGGGVRVRLREGFSFGVGAERLDIDFLRPDRDRSSSGTSPVAEVAWEGGALALGARASWVSLEPKEGSQFIPFEDVLGSVQLRYEPAGRTSIVAYTGRTLGFSYLDERPYYADTRTGLSLERRLGWRSGVRIFVEAGNQDFTAVDGGAGARAEDLTAVGGALTLQVRRSLSVTIGASRSEYDSQDAERDRSVTRIEVSLRSGNQRAQWW